MEANEVKGLPRMRGDPPKKGFPVASEMQSTPHARGSTRGPDWVHNLGDVYPACAGIHPSIFDSFNGFNRLPRMRGDPPSYLPEVWTRN